MDIKRFAYIAVFAIFLTGCSGSNLHVADFMFGNKRVGLQSEEPTFQAGEEVQLSFCLRGFAADSSGNGKATCRTAISPDLLRKSQSARLPATEDHSFKVNSEITSLDFGRSTFVIPIDAEGEYELIISAKDEVAGKEIVHKTPFRVEPAQGEKAGGVIDSLKRESEMNLTKACSSNLFLIQTAIEMYATQGELPTNLAQLTPEYLVHSPECPVALEDTYSSSYKPGKNGTYSLYCSGTHHAVVGLPANFPALRDGEVVYR